MVRRVRSSRGAFRAVVGERGAVRRVGFRAVCLRIGVARRVGRAGRFAERRAEAGFLTGFAFLVPRRALRLAI